VLSPYLPEEIHPSLDSRFVSRILAVNVYDPLVRTGATGEAVPALASTWSNPSPDLWRFKLRADARFSDGTKVTAADVVRSFERARLPGSIVAGNLAEVREIRAESPGVVTITAAEGSSDLLQTLTSVLIAKESAGGREGLRFIGSGPYEVTRFVPGERVEMRASPTRAGRVPHVTEAVWKPYGEGAASRESLRADPRTVVIDPPAEAVAWAATDRRFAISSEFSGALAYLAFGLSPAEGGGTRPFAGLESREAVRLALDVPALLAGIGPAAGYPATQVVPSGVFGFDRGIPLRNRDLAAARALLAGTRALQRRVLLDTTRQNERTARAIAAQLEEAGLSIDVRVHPSRDFLELIDGGSDLFLFSWVVGPDAGEALKNFFHSRDDARHLGLRNRTAYRSAEFDAAIMEALATAEPADRLPRLQRALRVLDRDVPWVPLFTIRSVRIHPADLRLHARSDAMILLADLAPAP
jgi:peptide/nickel transport system substrate-binding protein